jgi:iron complex transport system substrate-binding protein
VSTWPRIVSLLPAATEMACVLGLERFIVGVSFECDFPPAITGRPRVVNSRIQSHDMTPREIDEQVSALLQRNASLYVIDEELLQRLNPDIILTQNLCQVCAPSGHELSVALSRLEHKPEVVFLSPHSVADIEKNFLELAYATGRTEQVEEILERWHYRLEVVRHRSSTMKRRPRVFCMDWVDPIYCAGHWLAEMIEIAGGEDKLGRKGKDSVRVEWNDVLEWQPEILIIAPCGYNKQQAEEQMKLLYDLPGWDSLPAVQRERVYPVDANSYFVRPGPRIIDGLEILASIFVNR